MNKQTKKDFIELFAQGFAEVVAPEIEGLRKEMKDEFKGVNKRLTNVENRLETVETRLDVVERKLDTVVDDHITHEKRIKKLESRRALA